MKFINFLTTLLSNDPASPSVKRFMMLVGFFVLIVSYEFAEFTKFIPPIDLWNSMIYLVVFLMGGGVVEKFSSYFNKNKDLNQDTIKPDDKPKT